MTKSVVRNGNVDEALKNLKQQTVRSGLLAKVREKEHYDKPGVRKRNAKKEAIKKSRKNARKNN